MAGSPTAAVGSKFHADGSLRPYPGLSVVSTIPPQAPQHAALVELQRALMAQPWGRLFAPLPADSLHVTVFDLVCDQVRVSEHWSRLLSLDAPLAEVEAFVAERLASVLPNDQLRLRLATLRDWQVTAKATLVPTDDAAAGHLAGLREHLSSATGVRHPVHNQYRFHVSLAYLLNEPTGATRAAIDAFLAAYELDLGAMILPPPRLVRFPDMGSFLPVT